MATLQIRGTTIDYGADWSDFKKWIDGTNAKLRYTYTDTGVCYEILALDGAVFRLAGINKSDPPHENQIDFENNFKSQGNVAFEPRSNDGGLVVAQSPYAFSGEKTRFTGYLYSCPPGTNIFQEKLNQSIKLQGGYYWVQNPSLGDKVSLAVVDVDDILGYGSNTILSEYVKQMPIAPWDHHQEIEASTAALISSGLYLQLKYENTSASTVNFGVTYRWFQS